MAWAELIGTRVIVRDNEKEPAWVGTLTRTETIHGDKLWPIVVREMDGVELLVMGILLPFNQAVLDTLNAMPHPQAWQFCVGFSHLTQARFPRK